VPRSKNKVSGDIEWYLISIDRLKQIGLVIFLILLGLGVWWFWSSREHNPRAMAESAIAEARRALNDLAAAKDFNQHRNDFDSAQRKLDTANTLLGQAKFGDAQTAAIESQTISRAARNGGVGLDTDAQFITVEGDVSFQRASTADWKHAEDRGGLFNGDWVKTSDNASAQLMFSNGSLYTVGPNALLEIYSTFNPLSAKKENSVQVQTGPIEVATTENSSTVRTPGTQVVVDSASQTQIDVDPQKSTSVITTKGSASVAPAAGGEAVKLASGEKISASPDGTLSPVKKLLASPTITGPADNQVFQISPDSRVIFAWDPQAGATGYLLQVSRSQIFTTQEVNSRRTKPGATAKLTDDGVFYWRVASISADGSVGPFSPTRRFRASGTGTNVTPGAANQEAPPPNLTLIRPFPVSNEFYIIEGTTDPGSTVFIAGEEVEVESNGHFKKLVSFNKPGRNIVVIQAVNAAGKPTIKNQEVLVENE
jgi:Glucodextranase, domain B/FecR protein